MPRDPYIRDRRQKAILEILAQRKLVREQKELVESLRSMGFVATQSSISRDLRDLGVIRINGYYTMPLRPDKSQGLNQVLDEYLESAVTVSQYMTVLKVVPGTSILVSRTITEMEWPEVVSTLATLDDKVLVLTLKVEDQRLLFRRLRDYMYDEIP